MQRAGLQKIIQKIKLNNMYSWVSDGSVRKYHRAVAQLTKENADRTKLNQPLVPITDEAIKALYIKWGGLLIGEEAPEAAPTPVENEVPAEAKPKVAKK